ncbi:MULTISPECIES: hypothetical protein [unclassified Paenibacillus]|uniref:hypothetical protein n=1 Tax=unclassified Paenibacillus TaxID=185978 RepID=UPI001C10ED82|nr:MULTISPECIES: hypothetical protein [unclassified Paenibacillus]MBU5443826.1 hypothetical protein [Paenibacillus sp. MSJ-34]CAH0122148.1 hypothetical protein PAE9249_04690 [Paenibacillus sp. CECT 9249]
MDIQTKVAILRQHEAYCYQICYYLIQNEQLSVQATREALLELAHDPAFFSDTDEEQKKKVRLVAVRLALKIKAMCLK